MRFAHLQEWLGWQETLHPTGMDLGLDRCHWLKAQLGWCTLPFPVITVAGTNGKGSTVAFLEAIYRAAGYRAGTYTSPHLVRYNERIRVAGVEASDDAIIRAFDRIDSARGYTTVTYFEFGTFAAVEIFMEMNVDLAILEVGIGGRLDAVNVFDPDVALITPIDIDHVKWLGPDRESAGREKAGIMRSGRPVVISDPEPPHSLGEAAEVLGADRLQLGWDYRVQCQAAHWEWHGPGRAYRALPYPSLYGAFQTSNAAGAVMATECLAHRLPVDEASICAGIDGALIRGRFEVLPGTPRVILDIAHNPHAAASLAQSLVLNPCFGATRAVVAMLADKDHGQVLGPLLDKVDYWHVAGLGGERGSTGEPLADALRELVGAESVSTYDTVAKAVGEAIEASVGDDQVLVFGSCYTVGEAMVAPALGQGRASPDG